MQLALLLFLIVGPATAAGITGNWVISQDMNDGTTRRTYLDLKEDGPQITGHIRTTQFYYTISGATGGRTRSH